MHLLRYTTPATEFFFNPRSLRRVFPAVVDWDSFWIGIRFGLGFVWDSIGILIGILIAIGIGIAIEISGCPLNMISIIQFQNVCCVLNLFFLAIESCTQNYSKNLDKY